MDQTNVYLFVKNGDKATDFIVAQTLDETFKKSGVSILVKKSDVYMAGKKNDDRNHLQEFIGKLNK